MIGGAAIAVRLMFCFFDALAYACYAIAVLVATMSMGFAIGLMLIVGGGDCADFIDPLITVDITHDWWWYAIYIVLATVGIVSQMRAHRWELIMAVNPRLSIHPVG